MVESLSRQLEQRRRTKSILGIKITQAERRVNHSQFSDDTLLLGGALTIIARRFKEILDEFMKSSGGKIYR
jgi:CII-binding regulator of phage lambda lysogenization HflD